MKKIYVLSAAFLFLNAVLAQTPNLTWAKSVGNSGFEMGYEVIADASGDVYTTGSFEGVVDFDPGAGVFSMTSAGGSDIFIQKLDAIGNFVWAKRIGGSVGSDEGMAISIDATANLYITGSFLGTVDFDPNAGVSNLTSAGARDIFVLKLDASGNLVWAKRMGSSTDDYGSDIFVDASNNVHTSGTFQGTVDFDPNAAVLNLVSNGSGDAFIQKLDVGGNFLWAKGFGGTSQDDANGIHVDGSGNVYTTGNYLGLVDFDPNAGVFNMSSIGSSIDAFVQKLDVSGNFVWGKSIGGTSAEFGLSIVTDASSNIYYTGSFDSPATDFDPGAGTFTLATVGNEDAFVSKLNNLGNFLWAKSMGGSNNDNGRNICLDSFGYIYTTGFFSGTTDFNPNAGINNLTVVGILDQFIQKLDNAGNYVWAMQIGSTGIDVGEGLFIDASRNVHATGYFSNTADFDPNVGVTNLTSLGNYDSFTSKYCQSPEQASIITGSTNICAGSSPVYTLNPLPGATTYTWVLPGGWSGAGTSNTINPATGTSGTISVSGVNSCGTGVSQIIIVTVNPLPTITVNSGSICSGQSFTMVPSGASTYTFSSGPVVSPTTTTSYSVTGTSSAGCISSSPAVSSVTVNPNPFISIVSPSVICHGSSPSIGANGATTYSWTTGPCISTPTNASHFFSNITNTCNGIYSVIGTDANGCSGTATLNLLVSPLPVLTPITSNSIICGPPFQGTATLTAGGSGSTFWSWIPGNLLGPSVSVSPSVTTTYSVTGVSAVGCATFAVVTQSVSTCTGLSSVASAKEDLLIYPNPTSGIVTLSGVEGKVEVYNVLGELVLSPLEGGQGDVNLDLSQQPSGIYFIKFGTITKKIIKE